MVLMFCLLMIFWNACMKVKFFDCLNEATKSIKKGLGFRGSTFRVTLLWLTLGEQAAGPIAMPQYPNPDESVVAKRKSRFIGELKIADWIFVDVALRGVGATTPTSRRLRFVLFKWKDFLSQPEAWIFNRYKTVKYPNTIFSHIMHQNNKGLINRWTVEPLNH